MAYGGSTVPKTTFAGLILPHLHTQVDGRNAKVLYVQHGL
jgi:hypothetical protein